MDAQLVEQSAAPPTGEQQVAALGPSAYDSTSRKPRFGRVEKRKQAKKNKTNKATRVAKKTTHDVDDLITLKKPKTLDDVIALLLTLRGNDDDRHGKDSIKRAHLLLERAVRSRSPLASRVTLADTDPTVPSTQQLKKRQKRKEHRDKRMQSKSPAHQIQQRNTEKQPTEVPDPSQLHPTGGAGPVPPSFQVDMPTGKAEDDFEINYDLL